MKARCLKKFKLDNKVYETDEIIITSTDAFLELSKRKLVHPLEVSDEEREQMQQAMDMAFDEHFNKLSKLPISMDKIKQQYPDEYQHLKEKEKELEDAFNELNFSKFVSLLNEIEEGLRELANKRPSYDEVKQQEQTPISLNRKCVNCKSDAWIILKPNSRQSAIQCSNCNHVELHIFKIKPNSFKSNEKINLTQEPFILAEWLDNPESNPMNYKFDTTKQEWIYKPDWFKKGGNA